MIDLDELERLLREATAGPWLVYVHTGDGTTIEPGDDWTIYGKDREQVVYEGAFSEHSSANAALIAALRNHAEELIRDARRYRWLVDLAEFPSPGGWVCADDSVEDKGKWIDEAIAQEGKPCA